MSAVAVFDVGKTNVKLSVAGPDGVLRETLSMPNPVRPAPPYAHHDLDATEAWLLDGLAAFGRQHAIEPIVTAAHGSGGVLVDEAGPLLPMIDYEQPCPPEIDALYRREAGPFRDRGSPVMVGASHLARQMLWMQTAFPAEFSRARHFLAAPQYWAWRLCGVASGEISGLGAQSHLWSAMDARPTAIVERHGWDRLLPPIRRAWATLGPIRAPLAIRTGLDPATRIVNGGHDSSLNLYRYQAAGMQDFAVASTGTWIVVLGEDPSVDLTGERPGLSVNVDVFGHKVSCILSMGGREYTALAAGSHGTATWDGVARLVQSGTMALPTFGDEDGLFPGTARRGLIDGPLADDRMLRSALASLTMALLTHACVAGFGVSTLVIDGSFALDPVYCSLVAQLEPGRQVLIDRARGGPAAGAALLAFHDRRSGPASHDLHAPQGIDIASLLGYRDGWMARARSRTTR